MQLLKTSSGRLAQLLLQVTILAAPANAQGASNQPTPTQPQTAPSQSNVEWTVMVYMNGKNTLESAALANFQQMAQIASSDKVKIVAELGRPMKSHSGAAGNWGGVMRFYIERPNIQPLRAEAINPDDPVVRNADMGSPKTLDEFVSWAKSNYRAKKYLLIIWNHGQGWRLELQYADAIAIRTLAPRANRMALDQLTSTSNEGQSPSTKAPGQSL